MVGSIKENENNDMRYRPDILKENMNIKSSEIYKNIDEAAKNIRPEDIQYITD